MKLVQGNPILKTSAVNVDKEAMRWSLSWQPDGRCDSFTRQAILACAPPTSGVYGLFNFDCQIFIGASANIQEALLRHESETDFHSQHLRPTGFTFEPCAVELCKPKVDDLIKRFHPILQTKTALTETWSLSNGPMVSEVRLGRELGTFADDQEFSVHERERHTQVRRRFHFRRMEGAALGAIFVASAVVIFYLGMPAEYALQKRANGANPTSGQSGIGPRPQSVSSTDGAGGLENQSAEPLPAKPDVHSSNSTPNSAMRFVAKSASAADGASLQARLEPANTSPTVQSPGSAKLSKKWSVQISAAPAKDVADTLAQRLKDKGYDGYVVEAEVNGQTYYRVRVGHVAAREEAESLRQSLAHQEGYRDAYLTGD